MLCCEDLSRSKKRCLTRGVCRRNHRPKRKDCLSRSDLTLQESIHRTFAREVGCDLLPDSVLSRRQ